MLRMLFQNLIRSEQDLSDLIDCISPVPQKVKIESGCLVFKKNSKIILEGEIESPDYFSQLAPGFNKDFLLEPDWTIVRFNTKMLDRLNQHLKELGIDYEFKIQQFSINERQITDNVSESEISLRDRREGYKISTGDGTIELVAWTLRGLYYGLVTMMQVFSKVDALECESKGSGLAVPILDIVDYPSYPIRGLVDDISRGQRPTLDNLKKFIRILSLSKQNVHVLYIEDVYYFKSHPKIGENRGRLTDKDLMELQAYAKEWFITIIPGVEMLGHMENILLDPDYIKYAEFPGAHCLNITDPETKKFVRALLKDVASAFETSVFAPICDESSDFGLGKSKAYVESAGYGQALAEWYLFLVEELRKLGKDVVIFAHDIIIKYPEALKAVQKANVLIYYWKYVNKKKYKGMSKLTKRFKLDVIGGPAVFDWSRHYPYNEYAEVNMIEMGKDGLSRGARGLVTTKWGDFGNENFRDNIFYGLHINGQASWSPRKSNVGQIKKAFLRHFFGTNEQTVLGCMEILSNQNRFLPNFPNGMFNRYWHDPFVRRIKPREYKVAEQFIREAMEILKNLEDIRERNIVKKNLDNLDYIEFAAMMARHYGAKILLSEAAFRGNAELARVCQGLLGYKGDPVIDGFKWLKADIEAQVPRYKELWLRLAVKEGLENPLMRYRVLSWHYEQAINDLEQGKKPRAHQLKSEWIWRAGIRTSADWGNGLWYYFLKSIEIKKPVKKAIIQGIAANHLKIYINGSPAGEVLSRFALGFYPLVKAVQWFDVSSILHQGTNMLCVDGANWGLGIGGINIILHVEYDDGTLEDFYSDKSWIYTDEKPRDWPYKDILGKIDDLLGNGFKRVRSFGKPPGAWHGPITQPIWDKGMKSSISFTFGARNFFETGLPIMVGRKVYKSLFWLVPILARLVVPEMFNMRKASS
ncbi:MAG: family 20 glycosylhydrolase [Promethearchaeota archaeon]